MSKDISVFEVLKAQTLYSRRHDVIFYLWSIEYRVLLEKKSDTFVLSIVITLLPVVSWDKHLKIASSMEICWHGSNFVELNKKQVRNGFVISVDLSTKWSNKYVIPLDQSVTSSRRSRVHVGLGVSEISCRSITPRYSGSRSMISIPRYPFSEPPISHDLSFIEVRKGKSWKSVLTHRSDCVPWRFCRLASSWMGRLNSI